MIGKITTGTSFYHCLSYCLEDKKNLSEEQKILLSQKEGVQHKDRAEILFFNNCYGNARELASQFGEVRKLSSRVEKPVLHINLSLAPGESFQKTSWKTLDEPAQKNLSSTKINMYAFCIKIPTCSIYIL